MNGTLALRNIYLDYNAISLRLDELSKDVISANFDGLVIILRGGAFAGMHLAFLTGLPYYFLRYDRKEATMEWVGQSAKDRRLLLCEDFAGMGRTLIDCKNFLLKSGYEVSTLVICKDLKSASVPDYYCYDSQDPDTRFLLPWERYRVNPETGLTSQADALLDREYERTAWDMDGIFLDDIESHHYHHDLEDALARRDQLLPAPYAPVPLIQDIIITGRPVSDKQRTEEWLNKHQIHIPVVLRDDAIQIPTAESVGCWKGKRAIELGCTHYVESDAEQAIFIASHYPELRVVWWNQGKPVALQAYQK